MPVRFRCGHPMTDQNTLTSKILNGAHAGTVQYSCRQCHREAMRRYHQRQAAAQHVWTVALTARISAATAERYAKHGQRGVTRRVREHHDARVLDVFCSDCHRSWPISGPCEPQPRRRRA